MDFTAELKSNRNYSSVRKEPESNIVLLDKNRMDAILDVKSKYDVSNILCCKNRNCLKEVNVFFR